MTRQQAIESWLRKKAKSSVAGKVLGGIALLAVAALVLFITFWLIYLVIYLGFDWFIPHPSTVRLLISGAVLVLLFVGNATTDRRYLETYSFTTGTSNPEPVIIHIPFVGLGSTINPLTPDSMHAGIKMLTSILFIGPRIATTAVRMFFAAKRMSSIDAEGCAAVLAVLAKAGGRVPFGEVAAALSRSHDLEEIATQLRSIDGVMFLSSEPAGLSLSSELRAELRKVSKRGRASKRKNEAAEHKTHDDKPITSIVLLLRQPIYLDAEILTHLVNETFGLNLTTGDSSSTEYVVGEGTPIMAQFRSRVFMILNFPKPYFDDPDSMTQEIKDRRMAKAVAEHQAWMSVDFMHRYEDADDQDPYWYIGRLIAAIAPEDTLAVLCPANKQIRAWDEKVIERLQGDNPFELFTTFPDKVPVINVKDDDPRMEAAIAESRRRWPEFVAALENPQSRQGFSVKVPIRDGDQVEHLWLTDVHLEGDTISGRVGNEPLDVKNVRFGSRIKINRHKISDWMYFEGDEMKGGFSVKLLMNLEGDD